MEQTREPLVQTNRQGMELALAQARLALEEGEVPVGAIVVDEMGRILAQAHNVTALRATPWPMENCWPCKKPWPAVEKPAWPAARCM